MHGWSWYQAAAARWLHWQLTRAHLVCKSDVGVQNGCFHWKSNVLCSVLVMQRLLCLALINGRNHSEVYLAADGSHGPQFEARQRQLSWHTAQGLGTQGVCS